MQRIFVKNRLAVGHIIELDDEQYHHLFRVLKLRSGERIEVVDESGIVFLGELSDKRVCLQAEITAKRAEHMEITVIQGLPKRDKFEQTIRAATEIGAVAFLAVETSRSVARLKKGQEEKLLERWQKIAESAAEQSKRLAVPVVHTPMRFKDLPEFLRVFDRIICFYEAEEERTIHSLPPFASTDRVAIIIGPEGGLTAEEVDTLRSWGAEVCSLGEYILRTETAGPLAVGLLLFYGGK